ncbi:unnamed protein product [Gongylonema pulchrum]|uniref:SAM domain-containing protein n=1 Tax=Gongylonema pulchrum TaxID=637853 RepID=A0A183EC29_9BILA|nr:unnamed protein product [Gongylonema pulchrum]
MTEGTTAQYSRGRWDSSRSGQAELTAISTESQASAVQETSNVARKGAPKSPSSLSQRMIVSAQELDIGESPPKEVSLPGSHPLAEEINRIAAEQLKYAQAGVHDHVWELFTEEGEMKMYKRELQVDGIICDPLKAVHCVEVCSLLEIFSDLKCPGHLLAAH